MAIYDVYYRKKRDKKAEVLTIWVNAHDTESARLIAKENISEDFTIVRIKKS